MNERGCVQFLQWALPRMNLAWRGFRKVKRQVCRKIRARIAVLGLDDFSAYRTYLENYPSEWIQLDTYCRITISRFYRGKGTFDLIRARVLPELAKRARNEKRHEIRCLSAGCASGEEVHTLNLIWANDLERIYPDVLFRVTAIDADRNMLDRAIDAIYPGSSLKELPRDLLEEGFILSGDRYTLKKKFSRGVEFTTGDIRKGIPPGPYLLVLCRYLAFTYYNMELQEKVAQQLIDTLEPEGFLVVGSHEKLPSEERMAPEFGSKVIYRKRSYPRAQNRV